MSPSALSRDESFYGFDGRCSFQLRRPLAFSGYRISENSAATRNQISSGSVGFPGVSVNAVRTNTPSNSRRTPVHRRLNRPDVCSALNGCRTGADTDEWLSYTGAGERIGISAEAVRQRAIRGAWPRRRGNDGTALVRIPEGATIRRRTAVEQVGEQAPASVCEHPAEHPLERLISAMQAHIETLQADLSLTRAEIESVRAELTAEREAAAVYRRLTDELIGLRKASASPPLPPRRQAPRPRPPAASEPAATADASPSSSGFIQREEFEVENGMEKIRRRLEARLAARGH